MNIKNWFNRNRKLISSVIFALILGSGAGASFAPFVSPGLIEGVIDAVTSEAEAVD